MLTGIQGSYKVHQMKDKSPGTHQVRVFLPFTWLSYSVMISFSFLLLIVLDMTPV